MLREVWQIETIVEDSGLNDSGGSERVARSALLLVLNWVNGTSSDPVDRGRNGTEFDTKFSAQSSGSLMVGPEGWIAA